MARMPVAVPLMARGYASGGGPSLEEIKTRIADVIKSFEKVDPNAVKPEAKFTCLLYTSPSPRDKRQSRMPSSA